MNAGFGDSLMRAVGLILAGDDDLIEIIALSLRVTLSAVAIACVIGLPLGAVVGAFRFPGPRRRHGDPQRADGPAARGGSACWSI